MPAGRANAALLAGELTSVKIPIKTMNPPGESQTAELDRKLRLDIESIILDSAV